MTVIFSHFTLPHFTTAHFTADCYFLGVYNKHTVYVYNDQQLQYVSFESASILSMSASILGVEQMLSQISELRHTKYDHGASFLQRTIGISPILIFTYKRNMEKNIKAIMLTWFATNVFQLSMQWQHTTMFFLKPAWVSFKQIYTYAYIRYCPPSVV